VSILKPYSEPCFRRFSGTAIVDVCTAVRVLQLKEELIKSFRIFFGTHRVVSYKNTMSLEAGNQQKSPVISAVIVGNFLIGKNVK
jgi:hypothetical protein